MGIRERLLKKLDQEIQLLERELKVELPRQLAEAAAHGDLSENAEYDAAKQRKELVQAQLARFYDKRQSLAGINELMIPRDSIGFWSRVELLDVDSGEEVGYHLVNADESDPPSGRISVSSPIGKALIGKVDGDEVEVRTPRGTKIYEILEFSTVHEDSDLDE
ncbi:MAG: transcription elongation factor GreA [Acidobacteria bacterium]|nr:transcription elongation factor GreA [Acidobacteriota bacterium]